MASLQSDYIIKPQKHTVNNNVCHDGQCSVEKQNG